MFNFNTIKRYFDASIQRKLLFINLSITSIALMFAVIMAVGGEFLSKRNFIIESLVVQAKMVADNTSAALIFGDNNGASDILHAFSSSPDVISAVIYDSDGNQFAMFVKHDADVDLHHGHDPLQPSGEKHLKEKLAENADLMSQEVHVFQEVNLDGENIGHLFIQGDLSRLHNDILNYLLYTSSVALLALAMSALLLSKLKSSIVSPLRKLTGLMDMVTNNNDYTVRVEDYSDDEIGKLSSGFNKMLSHIQVNDERLEHELSERYKAEEHLDTLAYYDPVTELANRHFFQKQLDSAVECAIVTKKKMALMFLDLDNFKAVNDTSGHKIGDLLLKQASERLTHTLRNNDHICRIGGDEFAIIIESIDDMEAVTIVADKCIEAFQEPFVFEGKKHFVGVSIGISSCPHDTETANELLVNADMAMYQAKINGKNNYKFYVKEMNDTNSQRYQLETDLRYAMEKDELELYYQPQVDAGSGKLTGVEALMRWVHPEKGFIPPDVFIPIAEETGLIVSIGKWLINTACIQGVQMIEAGNDDIVVAINISGVQIRDHSFIGNIHEALDKHGFPPGCLEIELTESTLMNDSSLIIEKVKQLREIGVHIAIDDFGTGFSSMSYLKSFPVSTLKIDRCFVSGLPDSSEDIAIVRAVIAMAHGLDIDVIAEGVEDKHQAKILSDYSCDRFQGYYFARPMPFDELLALDHSKLDVDDAVFTAKVVAGNKAAM